MDGIESRMLSISPQKHDLEKNLKQKYIVSLMWLLHIYDFLFAAT